MRIIRRNEGLMATDSPIGESFPMLKESVSFSCVFLSIYLNLKQYGRRQVPIYSVNMFVERYFAPHQFEDV
jgi:hypothetical protein